MYVAILSQVAKTAATLCLMDAYARPALPRHRFYDAEGRIIDYGNRWRSRPGRMPPDDTYGVSSHPERFAPLHAVARALIDYLTQNYDVTLTEGPEVAADLMHSQEGVTRAVRVVPANPDGATLTFVFTSFPGVVVHAGLLHDFPVPQCGCDACDETADSAAGELEAIVLAVVAGHYAEAYRSDEDLGISYSLGPADSHRSGRRAPSTLDGLKRLQSARDRLDQLPGGWQPWTERPSRA